MALAAAKYGLGRCQKLNFLGTGAQRRYDASASGGFARGVSPLARIFFLKILDIIDTFSGLFFLNFVGILRIFRVS